MEITHARLAAAATAGLLSLTLGTSAAWADEVGASSTTTASQSPDPTTTTSPDPTTTTSPDPTTTTSPDPTTTTSPDPTTTASPDPTTTTSPDPTTTTSPDPTDEPYNPEESSYWDDQELFCTDFLAGSQEAEDFILAVLAEVIAEEDPGYEPTDEEIAAFLEFMAADCEEFLAGGDEPDVDKAADQAALAAELADTGAMPTKEALAAGLALVLGGGAMVYGTRRPAYQARHRR